MARKHAYYKRSQIVEGSYAKLYMTLYDNPEYWELSDAARILYSVLLDRTGLSEKNEWIDENDNVYVQYSIDKVAERLRWSDKKASYTFKELEDIGLIERTRSGNNSPYRIYVMVPHIVEKEAEKQEVEIHSLEGEKVTGQRGKKLLDRRGKNLPPNHTSFNYTLYPETRARGATPRRSSTGFHNFEQRTYDYDALEKKLFAKYCTT